MKSSKLILKLYQLLPYCCQQNQRVIDFVQPIAERELAKCKHEVTKARWTQAELEAKVKQLKADVDGNR